MKKTETEIKYGDIIGLPHYQSVKRAHMSASDRAAQFSPFAALTGFDDGIRESARYVDKKSEPDEQAVAMLDRTLQELQAHLSEAPTVLIEHFEQDGSKPGGFYRTTEGQVVRIDRYQQVIELSDGTVISMPDLYSIEYTDSRENYE